MSDRPTIHSIKIKDVTFGKNVTLVESVNLNDTETEDNAFVTKDILEPGMYAGNPAKKHRDLD